MIKILIVDDDTQKINDIAAIIRGIVDIEDTEIKTVSYINEAKRIMQGNSIDLLVLDICLPDRPGDNAKRDAGIRFLENVRDSQRFAYPKYVIAVSAYEDLVKEFSVGAGMIHTEVYYNVEDNKWKSDLQNCIDNIYLILKNNITRRSFDVDIAVICALDEELELVKNELKNVTEVRLPDDDYIYFRGDLDNNGETIRIVLSQSTDMGMVPAAVLTTRLIHNFIPQYIVMTGIAAGVRDKVCIGDIIAAEYAWDYGAGKEIVVGDVPIHRNTIQQIPIATDMCNMIRRLMADKCFFASVKDSFIGNKPDSELNFRLGPVASGASVVANPEILKDIKNGQIRDVIGLEMEIYGVYYAARWSIEPKPKFVALKSVCDFGDEKKNDDYHKYAAYTSAQVLIKLAKDYFVYL